MPDSLIWLAWTALAIVVIGLLSAAWNQIAVRRTRIVAAQEPTAVVYASTTTPALFAALESLALNRRREIPPPTFGLTLAMGSAGVEFWSGWRRPWLYERIAWDDVEAVEETRRDETNVPGVAFIVRTSGGLSRVPVSLTGGWPGGSRALSASKRIAAVERIQRQLAIFKRASAEEKKAPDGSGS